VSPYFSNANVKVTTIEPTYMPEKIQFKMDSTVASCTPGTWLKYYGTTVDPLLKHEHNKVVYSTLLAAQAANRTIKIYGTNECVIEIIHLM